MELTFTGHAVFQAQRRAIKREWIEAAISMPDVTESQDGKTSFLKCHKERGKMLHVAPRENDHYHVITAYFDRRYLC